MYRKSLAVAVSLALFGFFAVAALGAAENAVPGVGNALAIEISDKSALVRSAKADIDQRIREIKNAQLRTATEDAIDNPATCVRHRSGLDAGAKAAIVRRLTSEGLADPEDDSRFPGGLLAGIFPPLNADGSDCPQLPQVFTLGAGQRIWWPSFLSRRTGDPRSLQPVECAQPRGQLSAHLRPSRRRRVARSRPGR